MLKEIIAETQKAFVAEPAKAMATFKSSSALQENLHSRATMRGHTISIDEPEGLGGTDKGPNPVEIVLAALGTCQEITYRAYATAMGIPLEGVSVAVEGDVDLRGFFGVSEDVRPGYQAIRATVNITSSASDEQLEQLRNMVNGHCPVLDIVSNPVPVAMDFKVHRT